MKRARIVRMLERGRWRIEGTARRPSLGRNPSTLWNRMRELDVQRP